MKTQLHSGSETLIPLGRHAGKEGVARGMDCGRSKEPKTLVNFPSDEGAEKSTNAADEWLACNLQLFPSSLSFLPFESPDPLGTRIPVFLSRRASATATIASTISCWAYRWLTVFYQAEPSCRRKEPAVSTDLGPRAGSTIIPASLVVDMPIRCSPIPSTLREPFVTKMRLSRSEAAQLY